MVLLNPKPSQDVSVFRAYFFSCIFYLSDPEGKGTILAFLMLYQEEWCLKHFIGFKNNHQTNELCKFQRLSLGGLPISTETALSSLLSSFCPLALSRPMWHLLSSDFEIAPATFTCLRLCPNTSTSQKVFCEYFTVSLQEKVKESFILFLALAGVLLLWRMDEACLFVGLLRSPFFSYTDARILGRGGGGTEVTCGLLPSISKGMLNEWMQVPIRPHK